jgi:hypothetical protein
MLRPNGSWKKGTSVGASRNSASPQPALLNQASLNQGFTVCAFVAALELKFSFPA